MPVGEVGERAQIDAKLACRGCLAAVAGGLHEAQLVGNVDPPHQVRHEHDAAREDADDGQRLAAILIRDLPSQRDDGTFNVRFGNQAADGLHGSGEHCRRSTSGAGER
jgi:hypothetical protein